MEGRRKLHPLVRGFALLGLGAILVCGLVLASASPTQCTSDNHTRSTLRQIQIACDLYQQSYGTYPPTETRGGTGAMMRAFTAPPKGGPCILSPSMATPAGAMEDAWGTPLRYGLADGKPVIESAGPDGRWGTSDDLAGR